MHLVKVFNLRQVKDHRK